MFQQEPTYILRIPVGACYLSAFSNVVTVPVKNTFLLCHLLIPHKTLIKDLH